MIYFAQGSFGSGKTASMIEDCRCCNENFCVLTFSKSQKELLETKISNGKILRFDEFVFSFFQRNFSNLKTLSDVEIAAILNEIVEEEFSKDSGLKNLVRASSTGAQFYQLFSEFEQENCTCADFVAAVTELNVSEIDKNRLRLVGNVWTKFEKLLEQNALATPSSYIKKLLSKKNVFENLEFQKIFVDEIHLATRAELCFLRAFSGNCDLFLYGENSPEIKEYLPSDKTTQLQECRNPEIMRRIELFLGINNDELKPTECVEYLAFDDIGDEFEFVANTIKKLLETQNMNLSDFAIAINKSELRHKMSDFLEAAGLSTNLSSNLDYKNFAQRLARFFDVCGLLKQMGIEKFSLAAFAKARSFSKAIYEIQIEQLNLYFENFLTEIFDDFYTKDRFFKLANQRPDLSFLEIVEANKNLLSEEKQIKFYSEIEMLSALYKAFFEKRYFDFSNLIAARFEPTEKTAFQKYYKRFCTQVLRLEDLCKKEIIKNFDFNLILDISKRISDENRSSGDCVKILPYSAFAGREFSHIFLPFLTENYFPTTQKQVNFLSPVTVEKILLKSMKFPHKNPFDTAQKKLAERHLFASILGKATQKIILSTHRFDDKKMILPSPYLSFLMQKDFGNYVNQAKTSQPKQEMAPVTEISQTDKARIVVGEENVLKINQSAISNFQKCPRKFYYKNLLNIQETSTFSASYGTIVHAILEIMYSRNLDNFACARMSELAEILLNSKEEPQGARDEGFDDLTIALVSNTSALCIAEMKKNFSDALNELELNGFFEEIPQTILTEKSFEFELDEIPKTVLNGRIDAIVGTCDNLSVVDFKTGKPYSKKLEKYFEDENLDFEENPKMEKDYQYQLPLYFLASEHTPEFSEIKNSIKNFQLKYIRPKNKGGIQIDALEKEIFEQKKEKLIENLKKYICEKIRHKSYFEPMAEGFNCKNCQYTFACDASYEEDEAEQ